MFKNISEFNKQFYEGYDEDFLFNKAQLCYLASHNSEDFTDFLGKMGNSDKLEEKFYESLRAEVYFTEFHLFESFFALMLAIFQSEPHWIYLTAYQTKEIKEKIEHFLKDNISKITNGKLKTSDEFILASIYSNYGIDNDTEGKWKENIDNIIWMIKKLGRRYLNAKEYNAYKHGLRIKVSPHYFAVFPPNEPEKKIEMSTENSVTYLETDKHNPVKMTTKYFNPLDSINNIYFMSLILSILKKSRLSRINREENISGDGFILNINRDELINLEEHFRMSVNLPIKSK